MCVVIWVSMYLVGLIIKSKRQARRQAKDAGRRCTRADGEEAEQESEHQHRRDMQHAQDFAGELLPVFGDVRGSGLSLRFRSI